jgi:hypothetical protein
LSLNPFAFIVDTHDQALKHTWSPSDILRPPPSYCGYPKVLQSRIDRFSSIRMNGTRERIHNRYKNMGKLMISLSDQSENLVRSEVQRVYHGRVGGLSIFFEQVLRDYFHDNGKPGKPGRTKNGKN